VVESCCLHFWRPWVLWIALEKKEKRKGKKLCVYIYLSLFSHI
jgi:hypothetical protein